MPSFGQIGQRYVEFLKVMGRYGLIFQSTASANIFKTMAKTPHRIWRDQNLSFPVGLELSVCEYFVFLTMFIVDLRRKCISMLQNCLKFDIDEVSNDQNIKHVSQGK